MAFADTKVKKYCIFIIFFCYSYFHCLCFMCRNRIKHLWNDKEGAISTVIFG